MKLYDVRVLVLASTCITVEADSEENAAFEAASQAEEGVHHKDLHILTAHADSLEEVEEA